MGEGNAVIFDVVRVEAEYVVDFSIKLLVFTEKELYTVNTIQHH